MQNQAVSVEWVDRTAGSGYAEQMKTILSVCAATMLAGCAATPALKLHESGTRPAAAGIALGKQGPETGGEASAAILAGLATAGYAPSDAPAYLVQFSDSARAAKTGLFLPDLPAGADGGYAWLDAPAKGGERTLRRIVISFSDMTTGRELYRLSGTERVKPDRPAGEDPLLPGMIALLKGDAATQ